MALARQAEAAYAQTGAKFERQRRAVKRWPEKYANGNN